MVAGSSDASDNKGNLNAVGTSIAFNHDSYPAFFGPEPIDSPAMAPDILGEPSYDFTATAAGWIPEIMYDFSATRATLGASGINSLADAEAPANSILAETTIHMSPNKLGKNKVCDEDPDNCFVGPGTGPGPGTPAPEPGSILLVGIGIASLALRRRSKRR